MKGPVVSPLFKDGLRYMFRVLRLLVVPIFFTLAILDMRYSSETMESYTSAFALLDNPPTPYLIQLGPERILMCNTSLQDNRDFPNRVPDMPVIYFVTPTHSRAVQLPDLTRLGQTLAHVPALHWIVAEDSHKCSPLVSELLQRLGIPFTHMATPMPGIYRKKRRKPRGVSNRRGAIEWIRRNSGPRGVLYFGDDDNTYDLRLFEEIRTTNYVSMFPVGLVGSYAVSSPVCRDGKLVGFFDGWTGGRRYVIDMAGFAVNVDVLGQNPNATMPYRMGFEEDGFLRALNLNTSRIEPKATDCSRVYVWHTKTVNTAAAALNPPPAPQKDDSLDSLLIHMRHINLLNFSNTTKESKVVYLKENPSATTARKRPKGSTPSVKALSNTTV